ncbi:MAG: 1-hydroxycarotenoid 3,4-desaturase CrtD [Pseudomonadota bacterium]
MTAPRHAIVIGAGMGGLAAAAELAAQGFAVTQFERHPVPGGKMREVRVGDRGIDSGPTVFTMRWIFDGLFAACDRQLEDYVGIHAADHLARHSWTGGARLDLYANTERSVEAIAAFSDQQNANAYREFVRDSGQIFDTLDQSFMRASRPGMLELSRRVGLLRTGDLLATRPFITLWKELQRRFSDPRLVQLFGRYATYCGSSPFDAPATLMLIAEAERRGVWYVDGGMQRFAEALARLGTELGVSLRLGCGVNEILTSAGRVTGVIDADGQAHNADCVIYAGDTDALATGQLGAAVKRAAPERRNDECTLSAVTLSLVGAVRGWELGHHTVLFGDDYPAEFDAIFKRRTLPSSPTLYLCAQDREGDPSSAPNDERLFVLMNAPPTHLDDDLLQEARQRITAQFSDHGLTVDATDNDIVMTSPNEFDALFAGSRGSLYGRVTHGWRGSFQRSGSRSAVPGLYLAGGSVHPGAGIPMATQSGRLASACVVSDIAG